MALLPLKFKKHCDIGHQISTEDESVSDDRQEIGLALGIFLYSGQVGRQYYLFFFA